MKRWLIYWVDAGYDAILDGQKPCKRSTLAWHVVRKLNINP